MRVADVVEALSLTVSAGQTGLAREVTGGYAADMLSCAMAGASAGDVWVTLQGHLNVVAVADLNDLAAVIVTEGKPVASDALAKADATGVPILTTDMPTFEIVGPPVGDGRRRVKPEVSMAADLHMHTVLSPCAEVEMIPPLIVRRALECGLRLIAVTDHNTAGNCAAMMQAARGAGLTVLPGMEVQTREEVHVLCLFDTLAQALAWEVVVYAALPDALNPEDAFGAQYVVDAEGEYVRTETRLLLTSTDLSLDDVVAQVNALGGAAIPAHVDRPMFGLLAQLGFAPPGLDVAAMEISRHTDAAMLVGEHPELAAWPLITGSDAHRLDEMGPTLSFHAPVSDIATLRAALAQAIQCA